MTLKQDLHHWIVSEYVLEMPLTRPHTVMEFDHEIISQVAIIVFYKFSSEIIVYMPGSNPLCGLNGGAMANNKLFTICICSSIVANSMSEDTHSTLALSYIISRLR